jgi:plasmid replication initiation protein
MAKKEKDYIVKESNAIARARIKPKTESVWDERIIAILAARIRSDDTEFKDQLIDISELPEMESSHSQYAEIQKSIERLVQSYFEIKTKRGIKAFPIFAMLGYEKGYLLGKFNPQLRDHFLTLREQFALRSLPEFRALSGTYAQMLFRYLNSWKAAGVVDVNIGELHDVLSVPESFRKDFKEFRTRVLEPAHREITEKTSLAFTWEPIRKGLRKVDAVHFTFGVKALAAEARKAEATPKKKGRPGKVNRERDGWSREELPKIQRMAEECFHETEDGARKCVPQKKSEVCLYCTTRGRMWSKTYLESM